MENNSGYYDFSADVRGLYKVAPPLPIVQWCEHNIYLPPSTNAQGGYISFSQRPWQKGILKSFEDPAVKKLSLKTCAQIAKSTMFTCMVLRRIATANTNILWVMPSFHMAKALMTDKIQPLMDRLPVVQNKLLGRMADKQTEKIFSDGVFRLVGAGSANNLASISAQVLIMDEVSKYDRKGEDADEADPYLLAMERTAAFPMAKILCSSTPQTDDCAISILYEAGDMREFMMPCPHCKELFSFDFTHMTFENTKNEATGLYDLSKVEERAQYLCPHCHCRIRDGQKLDMMQRGNWVATNPDPEPNHHSYHLSRFYDPFYRFNTMAVEFAKGYNSRSLKNFKNSWLGISWMNDVSASDRFQQELKLTVPEFVPDSNGITFVTVDVQGTMEAPYYYYVARHWQQDGSSTAMEYGRINTVTEFHQVMKRLGVDKNPHYLAVDSRYNTDHVQELIAPYGKTVEGMGMRFYKGCMMTYGKYTTSGWRWTDNKGSILRNSPIYTDRAPGVAGLHYERVYYSPNHFKDLLQLMRQQKARYTWSIGPACTNDEYFKQLNAEEKVRNAYGKWTWRIRGGDRNSKNRQNHLLDCEVMQLVMARYYNIITLAAVAR